MLSVFIAHLIVEGVWVTLESFSQCRSVQVGARHFCDQSTNIVFFAI